MKVTVVYIYDKDEGDTEYDVERDARYFFDDCKKMKVTFEVIE